MKQNKERAKIERKHKYKLRLTIEFDYLTDTKIDNPYYYFEEHFCVHNLIDYLYQEQGKRPNVCWACGISKVEYLEVLNENRE